MRTVANLLAVSIFFSASALASEPPPAPKPAAPPAKPSALTGNALPKCKDGEYVAGLTCKPAPPGYYAEPGAKYPTPCPKGTTSPAGAKGKHYCS